jgi:predicted TPR repeat methyltransferase
MPEKNPAASNTTPVTELSLGEALALAIHCHRSSDLQTAETLYRRILDITPDNVDALHFLGVLLHQRDRSDEAVALIKRSLLLAPDQADRYNNFGNVLAERGRFSEATAAYREALARDTAHGDAWNNLGAALRLQGQMEEAGSAYLKAIELAPGNVHFYNNYGNLLSGQGRAKEAVAYYCKAITLMPNHPDSRRLLAIAYYTLGQVDAAAAVYHEWLKEDPDNPVARHMLASCTGTEVPERAADQFITTIFDSFAASFDQKLESLSYQAPQLVANAVATILHLPMKNLDVLDAGCGTGLCGSLIAPYAARLTGVDLSAGMLAVAKIRHIYDELITDELGLFLDTHPCAFDLIVSADTLVYFGELRGVFASAARSLRPGGLLIFTVEKEENGSGDAGYRLNPHGRYSHRQSYVTNTLENAGFEVISIEPADLRMESGCPVAGLVTAARLSGKKMKSPVILG